MRKDILHMADDYEKIAGKPKEQWDSVDIGGFTTHLAAERRKEDSCEPTQARSTVPTARRNSPSAS